MDFYFSGRHVVILMFLVEVSDFNLSWRAYCMCNCFPNLNINLMLYHTHLCRLEFRHTNSLKLFWFTLLVLESGFNHIFQFPSTVQNMCTCAMGTTLWGDKELQIHVWSHKSVVWHWDTSVIKPLKDSPIAFHRQESLSWKDKSISCLCKGCRTRLCIDFTQNVIIVPQQFNQINSYLLPWHSQCSSGAETRVDVSNTQRLRWKVTV